MKDQLKPNTYTVCESTQQCKELFEWAKANGIGIVRSWQDGMKVLCFSENGFILPQFRDGACKDMGDVLIPLPEFIARLKGEWVEGKTVTLSDKDWTRLDGILNGERFDEDYVEWLQTTIKEQLNNQ